MIDEEFLSKIENPIIYKVFLTCNSKLQGYTKILVTISGGSDSDIMLDILEKCRYPHNQIDYVFFDTGIEYQATKDHLKYLENKYKIKIRTVKPKESIPLVVKKYGSPIFSKQISEMLMRLQKHEFDFSDESFENLYNRYPKCKCALKWWTNHHENDSHFNINRKSWLKEFMLLNKPNFKISNKCCEKVKKNLIKSLEKENNYEVSCSGVRKSEGGTRATAYKNCFTKGDIIDAYRPIFFFTNKDKEDYKKLFDIQYSDCYEVYGLRRTGCAGCPFGIHYKEEVEIIEKYEPKLAKAIKNIFSDSYDYQDRFNEFKEEKKKLYPSYLQYLEENNTK